jgi:DNA-binding NtrC family response regulator
MKTALIIDDEIDIGELVKFFLTPHLDCIVLNDPSEALKLLEQTKFDVVISDYRMNLVDGFEILKKAHAHNPKCAKILMTGAYFRPNELNNTFDFSIQLIEKPFSAPELLIDNILEEITKNEA